MAGSQGRLLTHSLAGSQSRLLSHRLLVLRVGDGHILWLVHKVGY